MQGELLRLPHRKKKIIISETRPTRNMYGHLVQQPSFLLKLLDLIIFVIYFRWTHLSVASSTSGVMQSPERKTFDTSTAFLLTLSFSSPVLHIRRLESSYPPTRSSFLGESLAHDKLQTHKNRENVIRRGPKVGGQLSYCRPPSSSNKIKVFKKVVNEEKKVFKGFNYRCLNS